MQEEIDLNILNELKELMEDEFVVLLDAFIQDGELRVEELKNAIVASDAEEVKKVAHSFKGSSSNLGVTLLSQECFKMETMGRDGQLMQAQEQLERIEAAYLRSVSVLKQLIAESV
ncbi:MAG: Hpt domain-containing protein [Pseudomonadota bacterium]